MAASFLAPIFEQKTQAVWVPKSLLGPKSWTNHLFGSESLLFQTCFWQFYCLKPISPSTNTCRQNSRFFSPSTLATCKAHTQKKYPRPRAIVLETVFVQRFFFSRCKLRPFFVVGFRTCAWASGPWLWPCLWASDGPGIARPSLGPSREISWSLGREKTPQRFSGKMFVDSNCLAMPGSVSQIFSEDLWSNVSTSCFLVMKYCSEKPPTCSFWSLSMFMGSQANCLWPSLWLAPQGDIRDMSNAQDYSSCWQSRSTKQQTIHRYHRSCAPDFPTVSMFWGFVNPCGLPQTFWGLEVLLVSDLSLRVSLFWWLFLGAFRCFKFCGFRTTCAVTHRSPSWVFEEHSVLRKPQADWGVCLSYYLLHLNTAMLVVVHFGSSTCCHRLRCHRLQFRLWPE